MNKITLYPRVNVYQNAIPKHKDYVDLLEKSQLQEPKHLFTGWSDWYGFGIMMNLGMTNDHSYSKDWDGKSLDLTDEYAVKQMEFLTDLDNVFYSVTKDYIDQYSITLPNWHPSGFSICKYYETSDENHLAMHYHTDYVGANAEAPGLKFAITCTMYLNDDYEGGGLSFLEEETGDVVDYKPKAGDVVVFPSGDPITGASHYFHGVDKISNGDKYLIRTFWQYEYEGSKAWWEGHDKYGKTEWEKINKDKLKKEMASGKWHRYVVYPDNVNAKIDKSTPFFVKAKKAGNSSFLFRTNDN